MLKCMSTKYYDPQRGQKGTFYKRHFIRLKVYVTVPLAKHFRARWEKTKVNVCVWLLKKETGQHENWLKDFWKMDEGSY